MLIELYCEDGSPLKITPPDIYGRGVGGAELSMMTWAAKMVQRGHTVNVYNDPTFEGEYDGVEYLPKHAFSPTGAHRDVFIIYRSPNPHILSAKADVKIHWSTDQHTIGNYGTDIFPHVNHVVCISPFHVDYHKRTYPGHDHKIGYIDLGVRLQDYDQEVEKIPGRMIWCSVPQRGLDELNTLWPEIKKRVPEASLVITSDYRLWGSPSPGNQQHRLAWMYQEDVAFLGKIDRERLAREQLAAQVMPFCCTYDELFCISAAECQVAGAIPVTTTIGALKTTNQWGYQIPGFIVEKRWRDEFFEKIEEALALDPEEVKRRQGWAADRFDWDCICGQWERLIETGEFDAQKADHHYTCH